MNLSPGSPPNANDAGEGGCSDKSVPAFAAPASSIQKKGSPCGTPAGAYLRTTPTLVFPPNQAPTTGTSPARPPKPKNASAGVPSNVPLQLRSSSQKALLRNRPMQLLPDPFQSPTKGVSPGIPPNW